MTRSGRRTPWHPMRRTWSPTRVCAAWRSFWSWPPTTTARWSSGCGGPLRSTPTTTAGSTTPCRPCSDLQSLRAWWVRRKCLLFMFLFYLLPSSLPHPVTLRSGDVDPGWGPSSGEAAGPRSDPDLAGETESTESPWGRHQRAAAPIQPGQHTGNRVGKHTHTSHVSFWQRAQRKCLDFQIFIAILAKSL